VTTCAEQPKLETLIALFFAAPEPLGRFRDVAPDDLPRPYARLLAHEHHMTVTVEAFHHDVVDVRVLQRTRTPSHYAREILLTRRGDGRVVQYGIMRVRLDCLGPEVRAQIEAEDTPLGHVLIRHGVLREVHLRRLWEVQPGPRLRELFAGDERTTYGRTAMIDLDGEPAVELLEIVAPV
jgi:chorismate-pyruvate lyase